jgi:hypothetical protein
MVDPAVTAPPVNKRVINKDQPILRRGKPVREEARELRGRREKKK